MAATDTELLRQYREGSQAAFRELVRRHLDMVFSAARRQTRSATSAEEVTQSVFIKLARDAGRIGTGTPLAAWLHIVTRHTAMNVARTESRRQLREHASFEISAMSSPTPGWSDVEPLLDEAVATLRAFDRSAIILRFFEDKTLHEVGEALGLTEDAARKRISRALEQLRAMLLKRGVTVSSSVLAADLSTHAIQVAPVGLSAAILSGVAVPGVALPPLLVGTASTLAMTTMQKTLFVAIGVIAAGVGLYQTRTISRQSSEIALLRQDNAALVQRQASEPRPQATPPARREADSSGPTYPAVTDSGTSTDRKVIAAMGEWVDRAIRLRDLLKASSMWVVPEFRALKDIDWLDAAKDAKFETEAEIQNTFYRVRSAANHRVAAMVRSGLKGYAAVNSGMMPTTVEELAPYIDSSVDPGMQLNPLHGSSLDRETKSAILQRILESDWFGNTLVRGAMPPSESTSGMSTAVPSATADERSTVSDSLAAYNRALTQFRHLHGGQRPETEAQLQPFLSAPMNSALLKLLFETSQRASAGK